MRFFTKTSHLKLVGTPCKKWNLHSNAHILFSTTCRFQIDCTTFFGLFACEYIVGIIRAHRLVHWAIFDVQWVCCSRCSRRHFGLALLSYLRYATVTNNKTLRCVVLYYETSFYVNGYSGFVSIFHVSLTCLETFWGDIWVISVPLHWLYLMNEHCDMMLSLFLLLLSFYERRKKFC